MIKRSISDGDMQESKVRQAFDAELIRKLASLLEETGLTEIEYGDNVVKVRVAKQSTVVNTSTSSSPAEVVPGARLVSENSGASVLRGGDHPGVVLSPMVGTVYVAQEPGAPPFIQPGDIVKAGQILLIIEAMKVMTPLTAPRAGRIVEFLVQDGQPIEFGEALLVIE